MFSIFSWARQRSLEPLIVALACSVLASVALAETANVRLGAHFYPTPERRYQNLHSMSEIQDRLKFDMQQFVTGFNDCPAIVGGPIEDGIPRDQLRDTWTVIQSISVWCWATLQIDPAAQVIASGPTDRITSDLIHGVMGYAEMLSAGSQNWSQTLMRFPGGEIACKDEERCLLSLPDGKNPPDESLLFELILVKDDERFILVTQLYRGRSGFVYGVRRRENDGGGEVVSIFPDLS